MLDEIENKENKNIIGFEIKVSADLVEDLNFSMKYYLKNGDTKEYKSRIKTKKEYLEEVSDIEINLEFSDKNIKSLKEIEESQIKEDKEIINNNDFKSNNNI